MRTSGLAYFRAALVSVVGWQLPLKSEDEGERVAKLGGKGKGMRATKASHPCRSGIGDSRGARRSAIHPDRLP
jgi:hypothetical protein